MAEISKLREQIVGLKIIKQAKEHQFEKEQRELTHEVLEMKERVQVAMQEMQSSRKEMWQERDQMLLYFKEKKASLR